MRRNDTACGKETPEPRRGRPYLAGLMCAVLLAGGFPAPVLAQSGGAPENTASADQGYSSAQLDALLAPIALYPDQLLTQILMASTFPEEITAADEWVRKPANKGLKGDALDQALLAQSWDPSVKSLVPFPQVLEMMAKNLDWTKQLGFAMTVQQSDVFAAVQRLRHQAQASGQLQSNAQQTVSAQGSNIVIVPAQPSVVYVPVYNPTVVYGVWPYPAYPPVYYPPPPGYVAGSALLAGMAFGAGVAISAGLWGWCSPVWGRGYVNVNVNRYNNINVNRTQINSSHWNVNRPGSRPNGGFKAPPPGPVGRPVPQKGMPANSIGRPKTSVPGNLARPPAGIGAGGRPAFTPPPADMGAGNFQGVKNQGMKNNGGMGGMSSPAPRGNGPSAFSGMGDGRSAAQFGNRGAQSERFGGGGRGGFGGGFGRQR